MIVPPQALLREGPPPKDAGYFNQAISQQQDADNETCTKPDSYSDTIGMKPTTAKALKSDAFWATRRR